jgi:hypothetical protein
VRASAYEADV